MKPDAETLHSLYIDQRQSLAEIGRLYGVHKNQVRRWLLQASISTRTVGEGTSIAQTGKPLTEKQKVALRANAAKARAGLTPESHKLGASKRLGMVPPNKGKPMSEEQRQKLIAQRADPEYRRRAAERVTGEKSPFWKGGVKSEEARRLDRAEWRRLRREAYERDGWTCQDCKCRCLNARDSKPYPKRKIQAHHIIPRRLGGLDELTNLVTLCMSCHHKRERRSGDALIA